MKKMHIAGIVACILIIGHAHAAEPRAAYVPEFVEAPCDLQVPPPARARLRCGTVAVPRLAGVPGSGFYRLRVVVIKSARQPARPDALAWLSSGPGQSPAPVLAAAAANPAFLPAAERDVVIVDARAVGGSEPRVCNGVPVFTGFEIWGPDQTAAEMLAARHDAARACLDEARAQGHAPESFGSVIDADDVERVRQALGYGPWNVTGVSYGAVAAMTLASRHPESLRAVVLDSPSLGEHAPMDTTERWRAAKLAFLAACAGDVACTRDYPDLGAEFEAALVRLEHTPLRFAVNRVAAEPVTMTFNRGDFEAIAYGSLYQRERMAQLPALIRSINQGRGDVLAGLFAQRDLSDSTSMFGYTATICRDVPAGGRGIAPMPDAAPAGYQLGLWGDLCAGWTKPASAPAPAPIVPAGTSIPFLVLNGLLDVGSPPAFGRMAAEMIGPSARLVAIPWVGHNVPNQSACARHIVQAFLAEPSAQPDAACVADAPPIEFVQPAP